MKTWTAISIKDLRDKLSWSQSEIARRLGCRQQTISEWERGLYEPHNAYSKLLDMLAEQVEFNPTRDQKHGEQPEVPSFN
jgi:DNA-binding transcriptional regulator YiaG